MSYNDTVYRQMLARRGDHEYKLPSFVQARNKGPMPTVRVKADWKGQSAEVLLAKGDFLPPGVRDCPRAFTVPARESTQRAKSKRFHANEARRLSHSSPLPSHSQPWQGYSQSSFMTPHGPAQPVVWPSQPPPVPPMIWAPQPVLWTPQYAIGYQMPYPQMPYPVQMPASLPQRPHLPAPPAPLPPSSFPVVSIIHPFLLSPLRSLNELCCRTPIALPHPRRLPHRHQEDLWLPQTISNHPARSVSVMTASSRQMLFSARCEDPFWTSSSCPSYRPFLSSSASTVGYCHVPIIIHSLS